MNINWSGALDLCSKGISPNIDFHSKNFYVPTRSFTLGFPSENGDGVKDQNGNDLIETFGFQFTGAMTFAGFANPGKKVQFALVIDDGSIISSITTHADGSTTKTEILNNDGAHSTKFGCGENTLLTVASDQKMKFELDYYQGSRDRIAPGQKVTPQGGTVRDSQRISARRRSTRIGY